MSFSTLRATALLLLACATLGLGVTGCGESRSTAEPAAHKDVSLEPTGDRVTLYLGDGTDVSGTIEAVTAKELTLRVSNDNPDVSEEARPEEVRVLSRKKIQGLILDTEPERAAAQLITTDPMMLIAAGRYVYAARQEIDANIQPQPCETDHIPLIHAQLNPKGQLEDVRLLASSGCEDLDKAVIKGFKATHFLPLPSEYTLKLYPMNYYYEQDRVKQAQPTEGESQV